MQSGVSAARVLWCSGKTGRVLDVGPGAFWETTADLHESFGPQTGSGMRPGTEAGCGLGSEAQSPVVAP